MLSPTTPIFSAPLPAKRSFTAEGLLQAQALFADLAPELVQLVYQTVADSCDCYLWDLPECNPEALPPEQAAAAVAFTHLLANDGELVTARHLSMLGEHFSLAEVTLLTKLVVHALSCCGQEEALARRLQQLIQLPAVSYATGIAV